MKGSPLFAEIQDEARLETRQADVLAVLEVRFGRETAARFAAAVHRVANLEKLDRLLRRAIRCATAEEFQKGLRTR